MNKIFSKLFGLVIFIFPLTLVGCSNNDIISSDPSLEIVSPTTDIFVGDTLQLTFESQSLSLDNFIWESSDISIAKVDSNGLLTALDEGEVTITLSNDGYSDSINLNIEYRPFDGFSFVLEDSSYIVSQYNGRDKTISIPRTYNSKPVTGIATGAFYNCDLKSVFIPINIIEIDANAFYNAGSLEIYYEGEDIPETWSSAWNPSNYLVYLGSYNGIYGEYEGFKYFAYKGDDNYPYLCITKYLGGPNPYVKIPSEIEVDGEKITVDSIASSSIGQYGVFSFSTTIIQVFIPDTIVSIGDYAFYSCVNLEKVIFGENSQLTYIGDSAFYDCKSLTSIYIPDSVITIGDQAFSNCSNLTTVTIGENSQLTTIGYWAFYNCLSLTSIYIPDSVALIEADTFDGCSNLIIYCEASSKPDGWHSDWCYTSTPYLIKLTVVWNSYLGVHDTLNGLEYAICINEDGNKYITILGYKGSNSDIVIPEYIEVNGEKIVVKIINYKAFYDNDTITSVTIPSSVTTIDADAFRYCSSLTSIYIPSSVTTVGSYAFEGCSCLTIYCEASSEPSGWDYRWNSSDQPILWNCTDYGITVEGIRYGVLIDEDGNKYITILGYKGSNSDIVIPEYLEVNGEKIVVKIINYKAFYDNDTITSVTIPSSVTTIESSVFYNCSNLTTVIIEGDSQLTTIYADAFRYCSSLTSIYIPSSVTTIENNVFYNCSNLTTVTIEGDSQLTTIEYGVFQGCSSLTSIYIPSSVTSIGSHAFYECSNLTTVTISENSLLTAIDSNAFFNCSSLTSFYIPDSVTTIGHTVFTNCSNLTIYCEASSKPIGWYPDWNLSNEPVVWGTTYLEYLAAIA